MTVSDVHILFYLLFDLFNQENSFFMVFPCCSLVKLPKALESVPGLQSEILQKLFMCLYLFQVYFSVQSLAALAAVLFRQITM